jgi:hypothetical protein
MPTTGHSQPKAPSRSQRREEATKNGRRIELIATKKPVNADNNQRVNLVKLLKNR